MTRSTLRRASAAAVAVLALMSVAACGGDDEGDSDGDATSAETSDAASPGDAADPEASTGDDASEGADDKDAKKATEVGDEIDKSEFVDVFVDAMDKATTAEMTLTFAGTAAFGGTGSADFTTDPPSMELSIDDPSTGTKQTMVIVDGKAYLGMTPDQFVEYDLDAPDSPLGDLADQLNPGAMVDVFENGITRSAYVGDEKVDGESMEHYNVTVDAAAMYDEGDLPEGAPSPSEESEIVFDVWFDQDGLVRRLNGNLEGAAGSVELGYDNWGAPVDIEAPPKSQITKLPS